MGLHGIAEPMPRGQAFVRQDAADALGLAITHAHVGAAAQRLALAAGVGVDLFFMS